MFIQMDFNITKCLKKLGFDVIERERKSIAIRNDIQIYFLISSKLSTNTISFVDMQIFEKNDLVYQGITPFSEEALINLLDLLFPSPELIEQINNHLLNIDEYIAYCEQNNTSVQFQAFQ